MRCGARYRAPHVAGMTRARRGKVRRRLRDLWLFLSRGACSLKDAHKLLIATADLFDGRFACHLFVSPGHKGVPESSAAHGKADEPGNRRGCWQPLTDLVVIF